jgi:hypothetical protein
MIEPDQKEAKRKLNRLHIALEGVMMCCSGADCAHRLAIVLRGELRQILRLLGEDEDEL